MRLVAPLVVDYSASRRLVADYFIFAARPGASARRVARHAARRATRRRRLLCLRRASGCLGTSRGSSCGLSRHSSSSTTLSSPRVRVPRHVARLVMQLVVPLVIDYSASRRLVVVDYFAFAARPGALAIARLVMWLVAPLVVGYFIFVARPGASARRAARHAAHRAARRRLLRLAQARR
jgi:hypothetical protein